jgi:type I restriction enzyme M protein
MLTAKIRDKVDQVRNVFWAGGIANPLEMIEPIAYLLFMLDQQMSFQKRGALRSNDLGRCLFQSCRSHRGL